MWLEGIIIINTEQVIKPERDMHVYYQHISLFLLRVLSLLLYILVSLMCWFKVPVVQDLRTVSNFVLNL